eukprot:Sspe_Gene.79000::Locus_49491_Transcript_1_1_Confidence_1.000_Length_964::g.79000::m.79000
MERKEGWLEEQVAELRRLYPTEVKHPPEPPEKPVIQRDGEEEEEATEDPEPPMPAPEKGAPRESRLTPTEFAERYSSQALLRLAAHTNQFVTELVARIKELCGMLEEEDTELKVEILRSLNVGFEWFAAPARQVETEETAQNVNLQLWFGDKNQRWLTGLQKGISSVLRHKVLKEELLLETLQLALLSMEVLGQASLVPAEGDDRAQLLLIVSHLAQVELHVQLAEIIRRKGDEGKPAPSRTKVVTVSTRILEFITVFLVDEQENLPVPSKAHRWSSISADSLNLVFKCLTDSYSTLLQYYESREGE